MQTQDGWRESQFRLPDGRQLGYAECGDPAGKPLVYFHGGLSSRLDIMFAARTCKEKGIRLIAPDRPGIGLSDRKPQRTLLDWPDDVAHLMDHLSIDKAFVLGWSAGGPFSLACAYKIPQRLHRAGTSGCVAPMVWPGSVEDLGLEADRILISNARHAPALVPLILRASKLIPPQMLKSSLLREVSSQSDKKIVQEMSLKEATEFFLEALRPGVDGTADDYRAISIDWGFQVSDIQAPVYMWQGAEDNLVPPSHSKYLERKMPNAKHFKVPEAGHFLLHKHLDAVLTDLTT